MISRRFNSFSLAAPETMVAGEQMSGVGLAWQGVDFWSLFGSDFTDFGAAGLWSNSWGELPGASLVSRTSPSGFFAASLAVSTIEAPTAAALQAEAPATAAASVEVPLHQSETVWAVHTANEHAGSPGGHFEALPASILALFASATAATESHALAIETGGGGGGSTTSASVAPGWLLGLTLNGALDLSRLTGDLTLDMSTDRLTMPGDARPVTFGDIYAGHSSVIGNNGDGHYTGTQQGDRITAGSGDDWFHTFGGGDVLTGGGGSDVFQFMAADLGKDAGTRITDFTVGTDHLDVADILAAAGTGHTYSDVIRVVADSNGALVQGLVDGQWKDIALLSNVVATVDVNQLVL